MISIRDMALSIISKNPQFANDPKSQEMINAIRTNDQIKGEEIARGLCSEHGMTTEQATCDAKRFFNMKS